MEDMEESGRRLSGMVEEILYGEQMEVLPVAGMEYVLMRSRMHTTSAFLLHDEEGFDSSRWKVVFKLRNGSYTEPFGVGCACCLEQDRIDLIVTAAKAVGVKSLYLRAKSVWVENRETGGIYGLEAGNHPYDVDLYPFIKFSESFLTVLL